VSKNKSTVIFPELFVGTLERLSALFLISLDLPSRSGADMEVEDSVCNLLQTFGNLVVRPLVDILGRVLRTPPDLPGKSWFGAGENPLPGWTI
jgi:hypothetical protein